jgi:hypothetical protein
MYRMLSFVNRVSALGNRTISPRTPFVCCQRTFVISNRLSMPSRDKYTDPELRDEVKEEIHEGDKGGAPGQWSARKVRYPTHLCLHFDQHK